MIREIDGGASSHMSQNSIIAHFGLGTISKIDKITVYWTGGNEQSIANIPVNKQIVITEIPAAKRSYTWLYVSGALLAGTLLVYIIIRRVSARHKM